VALDARAVLLAAERAADADFPDGKTSKLTKFALIGRVVSSERVMQVVEMRLVLTGMPAPRGQQYLVFFDGKGNWIGKQSCTSTPLWCEGSKVFLFGLDEVAGVEGNAWELKNGFEGRTLVRQTEYGSYVPPNRSEQ
jgi:hypothetical protein